MGQRLVIAHHVMWTAYGCCLPNDPRGSTSTVIRKDVLSELGQLHYGRKQVQPCGAEIRRFYDEAKEKLAQPLLAFDSAARQTIAEAFHEVIGEQHYTCYACAIMPDHVHLVIRKHKHQAEEMMGHLQEKSKVALIAAELRPANHCVWCRGHGWKVFLYHPKEVRRTIKYVEDNPLPLGEPKQVWPFVNVYDDWPLHPGHSPNSPYARRLRALGEYP